MNMKKDIFSVVVNLTCGYKGVRVAGQARGDCHNGVDPESHFVNSLTSVDNALLSVDNKAKPRSDNVIGATFIGILR